MKHLPRALNRCLLFVIGLLFLATGIGLLLVAYWPPAREFFSTQSERLNRGYQEIWNQSLVALPGQKIQHFSWLDIAWITLAGILVLLLLRWIFSQGGGKVKEINLFKPGSIRQQTIPKPSDQAGEIIAQLAFVDDLLQDAISEDRWIDKVKTTAWEVRKDPGISLSVVAFKGADLAHVKSVIDQAIIRLDSVLGNPIPIAVHITTNWRSAFKSAERVDN